MQSLPDYLNNTQQCESILDPDQNKVMDRMTDVMIRKRIQEYCVYNEQKYKPTEIPKETTEAVDDFLKGPIKQDKTTNINKSHFINI